MTDIFGDPAAMATAVAGPHKAVSYIEVLSGTTGSVLATYGRGQAGGSVTADAAAPTLRSANITIVTDEDGVVPLLSSDPLAPYGNLIRIVRGAELPDGDRVLAHLGTLVIWDVDSDIVDGLYNVNIVAYDASKVLIESGFPRPVTITSGTNKATALTNLVRAVLPTITITLPSTSATSSGATYTTDKDRWKACTDLARSLGWELEVGTDGSLIGYLTPADELAGATIWDLTLVPGTLSARRHLTRQGARNVALAESSSGPYYGLAWDGDPSSPTYAGDPTDGNPPPGQFGISVVRYASPVLDSNAECRSAARSVLRRNAGLSERVAFAAVPNPAVQPGYAVNLNRPGIGAQGQYILERVVTPIEPTAPQVCTARATRTILS